MNTENDTMRYYLATPSIFQVPYCSRLSYGLVNRLAVGTNHLLTLPGAESQQAVLSLSDEDVVSSVSVPEGERQRLGGRRRSNQETSGTSCNSQISGIQHLTPFNCYNRF